MGRQVGGNVGRIVFGFSVGEKCDPAAIGRPLRLAVMTGLGQLRESGAIAIKPEVVTIDILVPIGALGLEYQRVPVGRKPQLGNIDRVEKLVEREFGLVGGTG